MRMTLRTFQADAKPGLLIAEVDLHEGDLWIEIARTAYNATYGYVDQASRELLASDFHTGTGTYPFGEHTLTFGRYTAEAYPDRDAPVWMRLEW